MKARSAIFIMLGIIGAVTTALAQPGYELRTYVVDPRGDTGDSRQYGMSKVREPWVCPVCGYSSSNPGNCPNPYAVAGHPVTTLQAWPLARRVLDFTPVDPITGSGAFDIAYRDTSIAATTPNRYLAVLGRPFHPLKAGGSPSSGSMVFAEFVRSVGLPEANQVHFVTLPPGVTQPQVTLQPSLLKYTSFDNATAPVWQVSMAYEHGQIVSKVSGTTSIYFRCINSHTSLPAGGDEPGVGVNWWQYWEHAPWQESIWVDGHSYEIGDVVRYGGTPYETWVCTTAHTAAAGNVPGSAGAPWQVYPNDQRQWETGATYSVNSLVKDHGQTFKSLSDHTSAADNRPFIGANWTTYWVLQADPDDALWVTDNCYEFQDHVNNNGLIYRCIQANTADTLNEPGVGLNWREFWVPAPDVDIKLNPLHAADGDAYYIRYISHQDDPTDANDNDAYRIQVYSLLRGLQFDMAIFNEIMPHADTGHFRLVTVDGSAIITLRVRGDLNANGQNGRWETMVNVKSNVHTNPKPDKTIMNPPLYFGEAGAGNFARLATYWMLDNDNDGTPEPNGWDYYGASFPLTTRVNNTDRVEFEYPLWEAGWYYPEDFHVEHNNIIYRCNTTHMAPSDGTNGPPGGLWDVAEPVYGEPCTIKAGEVGPGRVQMRWQSGAHLSIPASYLPAPVGADGQRVVTYYYDNTLFGGDPCEWMYDRNVGSANCTSLAGAPGYVAALFLSQGYEPVESRFLAFPYQVAASGDRDHHGAVEAEPADWVTGTVYVAGTRVTRGAVPNREIYRCRQDHTADATNEPGVGAAWTDYWDDDSSADRYARFVVGPLDTTTNIRTSLVKPGEATERRHFEVFNTATQGVSTLYCPYCKSMFTVPGDRGMNFPASVRPDGYYPEDEGYGVCPFHGDQTDTSAVTVTNWASGISYDQDMYVLNNGITWRALRYHVSALANAPGVGYNSYLYWVPSEVGGSPSAAANSQRSTGPRVGLLRVDTTVRHLWCSYCNRYFTRPQDRGAYWQRDYPAWAAGTAYVAGDTVRQSVTVPVIYECIQSHTADGTNEPGVGVVTAWSSHWRAMPAHYPEDRGFGVCPYHGDHGDHTGDAATGGRPAPGFPVYGDGDTEPRVGLIEKPATVTDQLLSALRVPEVGTDAGSLLWSTVFPDDRPIMAQSAVEFGPGNTTVPASTLNGQGASRWVSVAVPTYQRASEPGDTPGNSLNYERNWGYRTSAVLYEQAQNSGLDSGEWAIGATYEAGDIVRLTTANGAATFRALVLHVATAVDEPGVGANWRQFWAEYEDHAWDVYFQCPDCGQPHLYNPAAAPLTGLQFACQNPGCTSEEWCPICGAVYPGGTGFCAGDGAELYPSAWASGITYTAGSMVKNDGAIWEATVNHISGAGNEPTIAGGGGAQWTRIALQTMSYQHVGAEPYDPYDIQVGVVKSSELMAGTGSVTTGRVAPGVPVMQPDTTTGALPAGLKAAPANESLWGAMSLRNEGNTLASIMSPEMPRNPRWRLFQPENWPWGRNFAWTGQRNPIVAHLKSSYHEDTTNGLQLTNDPDGDGTADAWLPLFQVAGEVAGTDAGTVVQIGGGGNEVRTGQTLGYYSAPILYFADQNGNNELDFLRNGNLVTSAGNVYDMDRDVPLEPVVVNPVRVKVTESRLPYNGYSARDMAPAVSMDYSDTTGEPSRLLVLWMTDNGGATDEPLELVSNYASPANNDNRRTYNWNAANPTFVDNLPATAKLAQQGPADIYRGGNGNVYAVFHETDRSGGQLRSVLRRMSKAEGAANWGAPVDIAITEESAENVRGFFELPAAGSTTGIYWMTWHSGNRGQEKAFFQCNLDDAANTVVGSGMLPIDNSILPGKFNTTEATVNDTDGIGPEVPTAVTLQKFPRGPFAAVKDLAPFLYLPPLTYDVSAGASATQPQVRVYFAGYSRARKNFDIYETRFNRDDLLAGTNNMGKIEFERVGADNDPQTIPVGLPAINPTAIADGNFGDGPGEEFESDNMRQEFMSMHPDWSTTSDFLNNRGVGDVELVLGIKTRSTLNGVPGNTCYYNVVWGGPAHPERAERYDEKQGVYYLIPRIERTDDLFDELPFGAINGPLGPYGSVQATEMIEPGSAPTGARPVFMEVDPAQGRIRFTAPLFNKLNPADRSCVFNTNNIPEIVDVFLCGKYTPFVRRHTTSVSDDDCPTAIMQAGPWYGNAAGGAPETQVRPWLPGSTSHDLLLFWRRSFSSGQAPYFGRTCYMMKKYSWGVKLDNPPIQDKASVTVSIPGAETPVLVGPGMPTEELGALPDYPGLQSRLEWDVDVANGRVVVWPGVYRWVTSANGTQHHRSAVTVGTSIRVDYTDDNGNTHSETHSVGGWSQEITIPLDTVVSEGPLRVAEETYTVAPDPGLVGPDMTWPVAHRYWLFWTSTRPLYDLRDAGAGGSMVRQSSDIYYCTVNPDSPQLVTARRLSSQGFTSFLP